jgi:hypothetical protein
MSNWGINVYESILWSDVEDHSVATGNIDFRRLNTAPGPWSESGADG